jgi:hypothetical protein
MSGATILFDGIKKMFACWLPAQVEIIKAGSDFEEPRTLAASGLAGGCEVVSARARVGVSKSPRAAIRFVETNAGVGSELQRGIETGAGPVWLACGG